MFDYRSTGVERKRNSVWTSARCLEIRNAKQAAAFETTTGQFLHQPIGTIVNVFDLKPHLHKFVCSFVVALLALQMSTQRKLTHTCFFAFARPPVER